MITITTSHEPDWLVAESLTPIVAGELQLFYNAAADGRLVMPFCSSCDLALELDQTACDACSNETIAWRDVALEGVVHSVTTVHRREAGLIVSTEPYHIADVELLSTHRLLMTTTEPCLAPLIGDVVRIGFRFVGGVAVPSIAADGMTSASTGEVFRLGEGILESARPTSPSSAGGNS
jgi:uncharacterized protein